MGKSGGKTTKQDEKRQLNLKQHAEAAINSNKH
jgi:hypothetical protein